MKNTVLTKIMLYNNSQQQPSSTTTVEEDRPANTTPLAPLLDNNNLSRACELQSVSNASADIVLGDNAGTVIKNE